MGNKVALHNLGCKVNAYEIEAMQQLLEEAGYEIVPFEPGADIYVINTCTVTNIADRKSRQMLHKAKKMNPEAIVVATGCYVQTGGEKLEKDEAIDLVLGNNQKINIVEALAEYAENKPGHGSHVIKINQTKEYEELSIDHTAEHVRAYIKVQDGCNQFCTYCIIPYARGRVRSRNIESVLKEVRALAEKGYKEVVLTGIHLSSYGVDFPEEKKETLLSLIRAVHEIEGIRRIRLGSLEPGIVTREFAEGIAALPKVCPHFHLSLQSGCDKTLKEMNRKYDTEKYRQAAATLRKYLPKVALTTDIIVGFPGETEEDFRESYAFAEEIGFAKIHVFPYSPKRGTPAAARKDQLLNAVKSERSHTLIQLSDRMAADFLADAVGTDAEVLYERAVGEGIYEGHTTNYMKVHGRSEADLTNRIAKTHITRAEGEMLFGDVEA